MGFDLEGMSMEAYNKKVRESIEKTKKIREKFAKLKKEEDKKKKKKVTSSIPLAFKNKIKKVSLELKEENEKLQNLKKGKKDVKKQEPVKKAFTYKIKSGDTLSGIANKLSKTLGRNVTVAQLVAANSIKDKNKIFAGRSLTIPTSKKQSMPMPKKKPKLVTLKSGEPGTVAQRLKEIDKEKWEKRMMSMAKANIAKKNKGKS